MSFFETLTQLPEDPIFQLPIAFAADPRPNKVNLGIGTYRDALGKPMILTSVKKAERALLERDYSKDYLPIEGLESFLSSASEIVFGKDLIGKLEDRMFLSQALGGTGGLRVGGELLAQEPRAVFLPTPSWPNHKNVFGRIGLKVHEYRYVNESKLSLDFLGLCEDIGNMPAGSIIVLHADCHNPTGIDPTFEEWQQISLLIKRQKIIPFFDFAYQGFGKSIDEDAKAVRYFADQGHEMLVSTSFSKNFGLYNERVGLLSVITQGKDSVRKVSSQIKQIIRGNYSNPPRHGAQLISDILRSDTLKKDWLEELANMRDRLIDMRITFVADLQSKYGKKDWSAIGQQKGFFTCIGLNQNQTRRLKQDYAIYTPSDGRINIAGLNIGNINYVIESIIDVMES